MVQGLRAIVADDAALWREGVGHILEDAGIAVVGSVGDAETLTELVDRERPDVAIVDVRMPPTLTDDGLRAALWIRRNVPGVALLVLSQHVHVGAPLALLDVGEGGVGYLLKERVVDPDELIVAVNRVVDGGTVVDELVARPLLLRRRAHGDPLEELTAREREVLRYMAEGLSNNAIAERLVVTLKTVESHVGTIFTKLGVPVATGGNRRVHAVLTYLRATGQPLTAPPS